MVGTCAHWFSARTQLSVPARYMALELHSASLASGLKKWPSYCRPQSTMLCFKPNGLGWSRSKVMCAMNMAAGQSDEPWKLRIGSLGDKVRKLWGTAPQPVKSFPWDKAFGNFIQLILDLVVTVVKFLSVPLLAITSISEMSYCAHEKKLYIVLVPFLVGVVVAGVLREAALESSPSLKNAEVPWHLFAIAIFFTLLKLPGPYYPYWARIFVPHLANGVLWRTLWFTFLWYRKPQQSSETTTSGSLNGSHD